MMERKRFLPAGNPLRRGRSNRTDSQMSLSTMDSLDGENSISGIQTPPTTPASSNSKAGGEDSQPPVVPSCSGEEERVRSSSVSSREDMRVRTLSTSSNRSRSVSISEDKLTVALNRPDMELIRTYVPWTARDFPLSEDDVTKLNCDMDQPVAMETVTTPVTRKSRSNHPSHSAITTDLSDPSANSSNTNDDPEVTFNTATPEDSNPSSPLASSGSSEIIDDDPNDPEWTVIGDQKVQKSATCPSSGLVLKLAKR